MANIDEIRSLLNKFIIEKGFTYRDLSLKIGRKDSYIQQYIKYGFPKRLSEIDRKKIAFLLDIDEEKLIDDEILMTSAKSSKIKNKIFGDMEFEKFVNVNIYAINGKDRLDKVVGCFCFSIDDFKDYDFNNVINAKIIRQVGDSMEPTIKELNMVLFDDSKNSFSGDGVYVVKYNGVIQIKRVQKIIKDKYLVISDNNKYKSIESGINEIEFIGKALKVLSASDL